MQSGFDQQVVYQGEDVRVIARRDKLAWWENSPRRLPEIRFTVDVQDSRAARWYAAHQTDKAVSCAQAWPPIPLR